MRHQRVVGDVPVTLVIRGDRTRIPPIGEVRRDDAGDRPAVPFGDLFGRPSFGGTAQGVANRRAGQRTDRLVLDKAHRSSTSSRRSWLFTAGFSG
jgi:hypothetical protein